VYLWVHSIVSPLPTMTRSGIGVGVGLRPRNLAKRVCMKLCELPPSMSIAMGWLVIVPERRMVLCVVEPDMA